MALVNSKFVIKTNGNFDVIDLTDKIKKIILNKRLDNALVQVHIPFSSACVAIMEYDPSIVRDFLNLMNKIVPLFKNYEHNLEWNDNFASSYIKSALLGNSVCLPFINGEFELDRFQRILLFDFNSHPAARSVIIQMVY